MNIEIRKVGNYYECNIVDSATTMQLGLLDKGECETLATKFRIAADALFPIVLERDEPAQP